MYDKDKLTTTINYYLTDHPRITTFTWSPTQSWTSTWPFLVYSITLYTFSATLLNLLLRRHRRRGGGSLVPLGPIPAAHSLAMCAISAVIFAGTALSASAEIRDTQWLWRRSRNTALHWLLCFPLGTRSSGRVFFWSYAFYLSRLPDLATTFFKILRGAHGITLFHLLSNSSLLLSSFLWLEFSQSFQVLAVLFTSAAQCVAYACRFSAEAGIMAPDTERGVAAKCRTLMMCLNVACHVGVLTLHFEIKGGCNGIGAWVCNSVLNSLILLLFFNFHYVHNKQLEKRNKYEMNDRCNRVTLS